MNNKNNMNNLLLLAKLDAFDASADNANDYLNDITSNFSDIMKTSSWWGSNLWARSPFGLRGINKKEKKIRQHMITSFKAAKKDLRNYENDLSASNIEQTIKEGRSFANWGQALIITISEDMDKLLTMASQGKIKSGPEEESSEFRDPNGPAKPEPKPEPKQEPEPKPKPFTSKQQKTPPKKTKLITEIQKIKTDLFPLGAVIIPQLEGDVKTDVEKLYREMEANITQFLIQYKTEGIEKIIPDKKLVTKILTDYIQLKITLGSIYGKFKDFAAMAESLPPLPPEEEEKVVAEILEFRKVAHNVITRWFKRKLLSMKSGLINRLRFIMVNNVKESADIISDVLNVLEDTEKSPLDIVTIVFKFNTNLIKTYSKFKSLIQQYYYSQDMFERKKNKEYVMILSDKNDIIKQIDKTINKLKIYSGK